ncbi:MAG: hypothetical protein ACR2MO_03825 [Acidimicrobiales bacterium]
MRARLTPLGAVVRGAVAGAAGTLAMDAVWYLRYRKGGGTQPFAEWEFSSGLSSWDGAPAPALVGKRLYEGLFQRELAPRWAGVTNNVTHWATGVVWGVQYGVVASSVRNPRTRAVAASALGPTVWAASYVVLPLAKLYKPIWEYGVKTLTKDLTAHMAYGSATATVFRVLGGERSVVAKKAKRA